MRALTWVWYLLALDPGVETRLHTELDRVVQGGPLTPDHLPQLAYLRQVIEETMRLYPPIPAIPRQAAADDVLCGHPVPRRSIVVVLPWVVHRHRRLWIDPDRFDPDNFSPERRAARHRFAYLPFSAGPRVCVGAGFAMTQMTIVVAALARRFRFRPRLTTRWCRSAASACTLMAACTSRWSVGVPPCEARYPRGRCATARQIGEAALGSLL